MRFYSFIFQKVFIYLMKLRKVCLLNLYKYYFYKYFLEVNFLRSILNK